MNVVWLGGFGQKLFWDVVFWSWLSAYCMLKIADFESSRWVAFGKGYELFEPFNGKGGLVLSANCFIISLKRMRTIPRLDLLVANGHLWASRCPFPSLRSVSYMLMTMLLLNYYMLEVFPVLAQYSLSGNLYETISSCPGRHASSSGGIGGPQGHKWETLKRAK